MKISKALIAAAAVAMISAGPLMAGDAEDAALTSKVKTALIDNPVTKAHQINVEARNGTVQLNGFVDSTASKSEASKVATGISGVAKVENNLEIRDPHRTAGAAIDDVALTGKVKAALLADSATKGLKINVETHEGVVQLNGFTGSPNEKAAAEKLAGAVTGVHSVHNNLTVKNQ